jgi:hypothetical protein
MMIEEIHLIEAETTIPHDFCYKKYKIPAGDSHQWEAAVGDSSELLAIEW